MIRSDRWWKINGPSILRPFEAEQVKTRENLLDETIKAVSYGTSSAGYDLTLSSVGIQTFHSSRTCHTIDPKAFNQAVLRDQGIHTDSTGDYYLIEPHGYALGLSGEEITMPRDHVGIVIGKSTYARCGLFVNTTPLEPEWRGYLVIELANLTETRIKVYANEGIGQLMMLPIDLVPMTTYAERAGKYQDQQTITTARV